jgi:hypothetical protein
MRKDVKAAKSKKDKGLNERVVVLMTAEQRAWIQSHSDATGVPVTAIFRRAIEQYRQGMTRKAARKAAPGVLRHSADLEPVASEPLRSIERSGPRQDAEDSLGKHGA